MSLVILLFSGLPSMAAEPAPVPAAAPAVEISYNYEMHGQSWGLSRSSGIAYGSDPQFSSGNAYSAAKGVIRFVLHKPDADGSIPIEVAEKWEYEGNHEVLPAIDMRLMTDGTVSFNRMQPPTIVELEIAQLLVPHLLKFPLEVQKPWAFDGRRNENDNHLELTLLGADAEGNAILTFAQKIKGRYDDYTGSGKLKYDAKNSIPMNAHAELRFIGNGGSEDTQIDYALVETKAQP